MITHLGTFDVENYGDLLYPIVFRHLLKRRDAGSQVRHYSPLPGEAPQEAGFETHSLQSLFESRAESCTLFVGGGDILRTDWDVVAGHYGRDSRIDHSRLRHSLGTVNAFGYLLRRNLPRSEPAGFFADRFKARWMTYPAVGPLPVAKADGFLRVMNLPPQLKLGSWNEVNDRIDMALELGRDFFSARAMEAKAKVYQVIDELLYDLLI